MELEKSMGYEEKIGNTLHESASDLQNEVRTCDGADTPLAQARSPAVPVGFTYFIQVGDKIKIGSATDFKRRLHSLQTGHPETLEVLAVVPASLIAEYQAHQLFAHLRVRGEWFRAEPDLLSFIEQAKADAEAELRKQELTPAGKIERTCADLIVRRARVGADTPEGHACSNLVGMLRHLPNYVRPDWATHKTQTLQWEIEQQMKWLAAVSQSSEI